MSLKLDSIFGYAILKERKTKGALMCIFKCTKANGDTELEFATDISEICCLAKGYVTITFLRKLD